MIHWRSVVGISSLSSSPDTQPGAGFPPGASSDPPRCNSSRLLSDMLTTLIFAGKRAVRRLYFMKLEGEVRLSIKGEWEIDTFHDR